ncbi:Anti-sigma factor [Sphingomonas antarctica]|uniref:anti-sigma factor n=1 Tax=Sphingomonas antarctica TaxID=2040274 RepID=UPI0039EBC0D3
MTNDDDVLAAEYAIGLLNPAEAEAVQDRARHDAPLSLRIAWWRDQLTPLAERGATEPPAIVWHGIQRSLAANDNPPTPANRWRSAALAAMSIAAALVVYIGVAPSPQPTVITRTVNAPAPMVALLTGKGGTEVALVVDAEGHMRTTPALLDAGKGDPELWVIPADGKPRSMGIFDAHGRSAHGVAPAMRPMLAEGLTFAVSLEPKGGSPTGSPTGPVVATGKLIRA